MNQKEQPNKANLPAGVIVGAIGVIVGAIGVID
jgi:hypothetical protein